MTSPTDKFIEHSLQTSTFFPGSRLFITGNPKVAGTSLRWWLLPLHGIDVDALTKRSLWGESAPYQTVWDTRIDFRYTWDKLTSEEREDALTSTDVLTVQCIRHPVSRTFSAWAGKYLTLEPYYYEQLPSGFDHPLGSIDSVDQISPMFDEFMVSLTSHVTEAPDWEDLDVHFWPQHRLLGRQPLGQTLLVQQERMSSGLDQIRQHLKEHGIDAPPMPRINESVVPYQAEFISDSALQMIAQLYAGDFDRWDYRAQVAEARPKAVDLAWLNDVRGRNRRYGVIHRAATQGADRLHALEHELQLERENVQLAEAREEIASLGPQQEVAKKGDRKKAVHKPPPGATSPSELTRLIAASQ